MSAFEPVCLGAARLWQPAVHLPATLCCPAELAPPPPPPTLFIVPEGLMCTAEGHVLGARARRPARAAAGTLHLHRVSHLHLPCSDPDLCFAPAPLAPQPSLSHFSLAPLATFSCARGAESRFESDCVMEIKSEVCVMV